MGSRRESGRFLVSRSPLTHPGSQQYKLLQLQVDPSGVAEIIKLYTDLQMEVDQKDNQGFDVSITDYWGRE